MWIVCITSVRHVLTVNGYGGRQTKENEKSWCFKGWETLVFYHLAILHENQLFFRHQQYLNYFLNTTLPFRICVYRYCHI